MHHFNTIDPQTVARATSGDSAAITEIVRSLQQPFFALARRMMLSPADAEDATQEALLRVITHLAQFKNESRFSTWAWRVAVNAYLDFREQRYRHPALSLEQLREDLNDGLDLEANERADDARLLEEVKIGCGFALLSTLDGEHRVAYILGEILELSDDDVAEILAIEPATFRKRLSRARERVRHALSGHCGIVNEAAACRCHRRLSRAKQLGRVGQQPINDTTSSRISLPLLQNQLSQIAQLQRVAAFYRADPTPMPQRDFVAAICDVLL